MSNTIPPEVAQQIAELLYAGQKIAAIKLYRQHSGRDLMDSKAFVDSLEAELRAKDPTRFAHPVGGKGCAGAAAVLLVGVVGVVTAVVRGFA